MLLGIFIFLFMIEISSSTHLYKKNETKKYHIVRTFPKSNRKIIERGKIDTPNTQIHDC